jgi:predicted  nucleic acid-binding Zn-ribbon protein
MQHELELLIRLQKIESDVDAARQAIDAMPARRAEIEAGLASHLAAIEAARERAAANQTGRRALEKDLAVVQTRLSRYKDQLMEVKTNREYVAMQHEIATATAEVKGIEDRLLELLVEADDLAEAIKAAEAGSRKARADAEAEVKALEAETTRLTATIAHGGEARREVAPLLEERWLRLFDQIREKRGGLAVVEVREGHCTACRLRLRPQVINDLLRLDTIHQCSGCARILYQLPQPPAHRAELTDPDH